MEVKKYYDRAIVATVTGAATGGVSDPIHLPGMTHGMIFEIDVIEAETVGDKLDIYIQTMLDGVNWTDVYHCTQIDGDGTTPRYVAKLIADAGLTEFDTDTALGEGAVRNLLGDMWRVRWEIDGVGSPESGEPSAMSGEASLVSSDIPSVPGVYGTFCYTPGDDQAVPLTVTWTGPFAISSFGDVTEFSVTVGGVESLDSLEGGVGEGPLIFYLATYTSTPGEILVTYAHGVHQMKDAASDNIADFLNQLVDTQCPS